MAGSTVRWGSVLVAAALLAAGASHAQDEPTYKCVRRGVVTYSQMPCGGKPIGQAKRRVNVRYETPPQDRAKAARRATLSEAARHECSVLDGSLQAQQEELKAKGDAATLQDEMPLVRAKKRYRELKC